MMSKRIIRFLFVLAIPILCLWLYFGLNEYWARQSIENIIEKKRGTELIYAGGSTLSFAIRDSNNLADLSEPYIFTLKKIQLIQPRQVILSIGLNYFLKHFDECYDRGLLNKPSYRYLLSLLEDKERSDIDRLTSFETRAFNISKSVLPFLGSKMFVEKERLLGGNFSKGRVCELTEFTIAQRLKEMFPHDTLEWSYHQQQYFTEILSYCKKHKIRVALLSTPVNDKLYKCYPRKALVKYNNFMSNKVQEYGVQWLDLSKEEMPDSCFYDGDHLNDIGAEMLFIKLSGIKKPGIVQPSK